MRVQVSGKHVDVGDALRSRIIDDLLASIGRYFERGGDAEVVVARDRYGFRVDCLVILASGQTLQSHGLAGDAPAAFGQALAKVETRIRRYKRRLKSHTIAAESKAAELASAYVLRAPAGEADDLEWEAESGVAPPAAMVIAESQAELKPMTVSMAVMELDLADQAAIVFRNVAHGGLSVVYRRADGNIGWIDPQRTKVNNGGGAAGR
jgi:ribosomal subunit interface protein